MQPLLPRIRIRRLRQADFFWLKDYDCTPLTRERDSVYLFFCVHFRQTCFVARDNDTGDYIGFVLGFLPSGTSVAYVHFLFVHPAFRERGIGTALMRRFCVAAGRLGAQRISLYTIRAQAFYRRIGFTGGSGPFQAGVCEYIASVKGAAIMSLGSSHIRQIAR